MYSIMWECQLDKICKSGGEISGHVGSYSLSTVHNPHDALYGDCYETFALHDQSTDRTVVKYVDVQYIYTFTSVRTSIIP